MYETGLGGFWKSLMSSLASHYSLTCHWYCPFLSKNHPGVEGRIGHENQVMGGKDRQPLLQKCSKTFLTYTRMAREAS